MVDINPIIVNSQLYSVILKEATIRTLDQKSFFMIAEMNKRSKSYPSRYIQSSIFVMSD